MKQISTLFVIVYKGSTYPSLRTTYPNNFLFSRVNSCENDGLEWVNVKYKYSWCIYNLIYEHVIFIPGHPLFTSKYNNAGIKISENARCCAGPYLTIQLVSNSKIDYDTQTNQVRAKFFLT